MSQVFGTVLRKLSGRNECSRCWGTIRSMRCPSSSSPKISCALLASTTSTRQSGDEETFYSRTKETHFGNEIVTENEKLEKVYGVFKSVANNYNLMFDITTFGIHRLWKDNFVRMLRPVPGMKLLDVAGGTGDIAFRVVDYLKKEGKLRTEAGDGEPTTVVVSDINQEMLAVGKERARKFGFAEETFSWLCADAEALPLEDGTFDAYTVAFGIRNTVHMQKVLQEAYRVLRPGGRFICLEYSHVGNPLIRYLYDEYSFQIIPLIGHLVSRNYESFKYMVQSIRKFPKQEEFADMIKAAGFSCVTYTNLTQGIVCIHSGIKL